ncbi:CDP-glycerol glycerophosphotransferase family protein, partial [Staphylococcus aureus]|nr:CDP-glycerol glycerophosphotransferase family protein [Staphylococcus aureus]
EKRFVYRMFMEFHCENDEAEPIVLSSTPLVLGDRKNKLKGLISVVNKDSGPVRYEVYKKKKKQTVCIRVNDYSLKTRMRYFIKGKKKR